MLCRVLVNSLRSRVAVDLISQSTAPTKVQVDGVDPRLLRRSEAPARFAFRMVFHSSALISR
jgi:hypothetical protein